MKLLIVMPSTASGGVEHYSSLIAANATQSGWNVHAAFPRTKGTRSLIEELTKADVHYHPLNIAEPVIPSLAKIGQQNQQLIPILKQLLAPRIKFNLLIIPHFFRTLFLILKLKPDVVMLNLTWAGYCLGSILACAALKLPTLINVHSIPHQIALSKVKLNLYQWAYRRKQQWLTISQNYRDMISSSFQIPPEQVLYIYNGIKTEQSRMNLNSEAKAKLRLELRSELGFSEDTRIILTVARLSDEKGHDFLIPAIPHLINEFPEIKFVWAGNGEKRDKLVNLVQDFNITEHVLFLGHRSDIPRLLQAADLFVFPTNYEGLPFALLEAMSYSLPVIATNTHGIPEVINHQVHGLLTRKGDSSDLLESIRWALRNPAKMMGMAKNAKERVKDFSQEKMLAQTMELLDGLSK